MIFTLNKKLTLKKTLLVASLLLSATSYASPTINQNPLGGGELLDSTNNFTSVPATSTVSNASIACNDLVEIDVQKQQEMQKLLQERIDTILNTREKVSKYDSNTILNEITKIISDPNKIDQHNNNSCIFFIDYNDAIASKELLRGLMHSQKNNSVQLTKNDVQEFVRIMKESNNRSVYSLLINQMLNINSEEKNEVATKDEVSISFDSLNIDNMFYQSSEVKPESTIELVMLADPETQFYRAFIYKYINDAQTISPKLAYEILSELVNTEEVKVTNLAELNAQLKEYLSFDQYKNEVIENYLKLLDEKVQKSSNEEPHKTLVKQFINTISNNFSENYIKDNAEKMIKSYNTARNSMKNHFEALPNVILSINAINKKLEEQAKIKIN